MSQSRRRIQKKQRRQSKSFRNQGSGIETFGQPIADKDHGKWETWNKCKCRCEKCFQAKEAHKRKKWGGSSGEK